MSDTERFALPDRLSELNEQGLAELHAEVAALSDDDLHELMSGALDTFRQLAGATSVTEDDQAEIKATGELIKFMRSERKGREEAAATAAAEIDALASEILTDDTPSADSEEDAGSEEDGGSEDGGEEAAEEEPTAEVAASNLPARRNRPALDLSRVRERQPVVTTADDGPLRPEIVAAVDVPGYSPGEGLSFDGVTEGAIRRANSLKTAGGGVGIVASYRYPYSPEQIVTDSSSAPEGSQAVMRAANQATLPQGDLVASGGWCAPSETLYDIINVACPDMLWDAPEIQLARGGLRYFQTPALDVSALTWVHTEADDISGAEKPCFKIPCPEPEDVRCDAVGICIEAGILTERHFPELVAFYLQQAMVAHEIRIRQVLFEQALSEATPVAIPETFGTLPAVFEAVALQAADMVERYSLCENISIEVNFPWWLRNMMLADMARRNGLPLSEVNEGMISSLFATIGVAPQFNRALAPAVPDQIGGETPATGWPTELTFLLYPSGALQIGRGAEVNLGVIHDSTKFSTNDYTAAFAEECVALINRGPEVRAVSVPICADGGSGAQYEIDCVPTSPTSP